MRLRFLFLCFEFCFGALASCSKEPTAVEPEALSSSAQREIALERTAIAPPATVTAIQVPEPLAPPAVPVPQTNSLLAPTPKTGAAVLLRVKWPVGDRYVYRMDLEQHSTNRIAGMARTREEDVMLGITYSLSVSNGGELAVQLLAYDLTMKVDRAVAITFDSAAAANSASPDRITAPFTKVAGSKLRLQLDAAGNTAQVLGLDEWVSSVIGTGTEKGPAEELLVQQFNEGFFRQMADFGRGLPATAVAVGSSWPYRTELPAGGLGRIGLDSTITLTGWEDQEQRRYAVLESQGSMSQVPGTTTNAAPGALSIASGTVLGKSWFDPQAGVLTESVVQQSMRLTGEIPNARGEVAGVGQFSSEIGQKITLKLVESTHRP